MSKAGHFSAVQRGAVNRQRALTIARIHDPKQQVDCFVGDPLAKHSCRSDEVGRGPGTACCFHRTKQMLDTAEDAMIDVTQVSALTAVVVDALADLGAPGSLQLKVQRIFRAAMLTGIVVSRFSPAIALIIQAANFASDGNNIDAAAELASAVGALLSPITFLPLPVRLLVRAVVISTALAATCVSVGTAADSLSHMDSKHVITSAKQALDLSSSCSDLADTCQELVEVAVEGWESARVKRRRENGSDDVVATVMTATEAADEAEAKPQVTEIV